MVTRERCAEVFLVCACHKIKIKILPLLYNCILFINSKITITCFCSQFVFPILARIIYFTAKLTKQIL